MKIRQIGFVFILLVALAPGLGVAQLPPRPVYYYVGTSDNGVFDEWTIALLGRNAAVFVIDALEQSSPGYSYREVVARLKNQVPDAPVLFYTHSSRRHIYDRIGSTALAGYESLGDLLVRTPTGSLAGSNDGKLLYGDVTRAEYRQWLAARVNDALVNTGADGVMLDVSYRSARYLFPALCKVRAAWCNAYPSGMDQLFKTTKDKLGGGLVFFTGLWNFEDGQLDDQQRLLAYADGADIEFFGAVPFKGRAEFDKDVLPYLPAMQRQQAKSLLVSGRSMYDYADYEADYLWQRYVFGSYLLAAGDNTRFHHHASFQVPPNRGRAGGIDMYADWDLPLGRPAGAYTRSGEFYVRAFSGGMVVVLPAGSRPAAYPLPRVLFDGEGNRYQGAVELQPGRALILLNALPPKTGPVKFNFADLPDPVSWDAAAQVRESATTGFLRVTSLGSEQVWRHDFLLDAIRSLKPAPVLRVAVRSGDPNAQLIAFAEVDDAQRQFETVAIIADSDNTNPSGAKPIRIQTLPVFRSETVRKLVPTLSVTGALRGDAAWHDLELDGNKLLGGSGRYSFKRWQFMRPIGSVDLRSISIDTVH